MPYILTAINYKGGVTKTTTLVEFATRKAREGDKVLFIDTDPDMCATRYLGITLAKGQKTIADLIKHPRSGIADIIVPYHGSPEMPLRLSGQLDIIPSTKRMRSAIKAFQETLPTQPMANLHNLLPWVFREFCQQYDWILLDPSPSLDDFNDALLAASQGVILPLSPETLAAEGAINLLDELRDHNAKRARVGVHGEVRLLGMGLMKVMPDQMEEAQSLQSAWQQYLNPYFKTNVPYSPAGWRAPKHGIPIWAYA